MRSDATPRGAWRVAAVLALAGWLSAAGAVLATAHATAPDPAPSQHALGTCTPLPDGAFAFASPRGVVLVDDQGRVLETVGVERGMPGPRTVDLTVAGTDLWVATEGGVARLRPASGGRPGGWRVAQVVATGPATAIAANEVWIYVGVRDRGVVRLDPASLALTPLPFQGPARGLEATGRARITALDTDGECDGADLLVGTAGGGVYRQVDEVLVRDEGFPATTWAWSVRSDDAGGAVAAVAGLLRDDGGPALSRRDLRVVTRDGAGRLVVAGARGALFAVESGGRLRRLGALPGGEGEVVTALRFARGAGDTAACAASGGGGAWVRPAGGSWRRVRVAAGPPADLSAVAVGPDGAVWVAGFRGGLWVRRGGRWGRVGAGHVDPWVNGLAVERDGTAWVATARGLFRVTPPGGPDGARGVRRFGEEDGLPSSNLHTVLALRGGGVAVGGSRGLAWVVGGRVTPVGAKQGLAARGVWALAERHGAAGGGLVVGTTEGVWLEGRRGGWERLSVASGHLADDFVTALALSGDGRTLWAGTYQGGVARVDLETRAATQLGGGRVNVAGLLWVPAGGGAGRATLLAATMGGLLRYGGSPGAPGGGAWVTVPGPPGLDVTGVEVAGDALWVATRRGVGRLPRAVVAGGRAEGAGGAP